MLIGARRPSGGPGTAIARFGRSDVTLDSNAGATMAVQQPAAPANLRRMAPQTDGAPKLTREQLVDAMNEDLAREYQAIIAYVVYSQVLKGPEYMNIARELEVHAKEELDHALIISKQI